MTSFQAALAGKPNQMSPTRATVPDHADRATCGGSIDFVVTLSFQYGRYPPTQSHVPHRAPARHDEAGARRPLGRPVAAAGGGGVRHVRVPRKGRALGPQPSSAPERPRSVLSLPSTERSCRDGGHHDAGDKRHNRHPDDEGGSIRQGLPSDHEDHDGDYADQTEDRADETAGSQSVCRKHVRSDH